MINETMKVTKEHINSGLKIFKDSKAHKEYHQFSGDPRTICRKIVRQNWNGHFFQSGQKHHTNFSMRDVGLCADSLLYMGYQDELIKTLEYALKIYKHYDQVTGTINHNHKAVNMFGYSCDALPLLIRTMRLVKSGYLFKEYHEFLQGEIFKYYDEVFDEKIQVLYENKPFSSFKHQLKLRSSFYDNCAAALLAKELRYLKDNFGLELRNPFEKWHYKKSLKDRFWVGAYFLDDISDKYYLAADANVFPYYWKLFEDQEMINSSENLIIREKLDYPVPCKITRTKIENRENQIFTFLTKNFHADTCHTKLGFIHLLTVIRHNRVLSRKYIDVFLEMIERDHNILEVLNSKGEPYKTPFYKSDEGMLWASLFYHALGEYHKPHQRKYEYERKLGKWE